MPPHRHRRPTPPHPIGVASDCLTPVCADDRARALGALRRAGARQPTGPLLDLLLSADADAVAHRLRDPAVMGPLVVSMPEITGGYADTVATIERWLARARRELDTSCWR